MAHAFGIPGTQNIGLWEALRRSRIRSVLTTTELAATFMAVGYHRASGRLPVVVTIPGPGFTFALTGLAEARDDSAALVHLVNAPPAPVRRYQFQGIDQDAIAAPLAKRLLRIRRPEDVRARVAEAVVVALGGEPGPVVLQWEQAGLSDPEVPRAPGPAAGEVAAVDGAVVAELAASLAGAARPLLLVGHGCASAARQVLALAEALGAPVMTTTSGRGVVPEDHPLSLRFDWARSDLSRVDELIRFSDCVLVLACKLGAASSATFALELPRERLLRVDASGEVLAAGYPARVALQAPVEAVLELLVPAVRAAAGIGGGAWGGEVIDRWRERLRCAGGHAPEPLIHGVSPGTAAALFAALRRALPPDGIVVADSGMHQELVRRHLDVLAPAGLILPSDYQSMGFGIPAAIGAALAAPGRRVVAVVGDGGFLMSGMEILTAVRERIPLTVVVFNDGCLNRIRLQQLSTFGHSAGVDLLDPDFELFAAAVGARYARVAGDAEATLRDAIQGDGVTVVEVLVGDSPAIHLRRARSLARQVARRAGGARLGRHLRRLLGTRSS